MLSEVERTDADTDIDASMLESMTQDEWDEITQLMISEAPRRFAILQELGERADGHVAAWGLAFDDELDMIDAETGTLHRAKKFDQTLRLYSHLPHVTAKVIWIDPEPKPGPDESGPTSENQEK